MDDIESYTNQELSAKLKALSLKHGPITKTTRRVFENELRKHYCRENQDLGHVTDTSENEVKEAEHDVESRVSIKESRKSSSNPSCVGATVYYGLCLEKKMNEFTDEGELVFTSHEDALEELKKQKGARMKAFSTRNEALDFSQSTVVINSDHIGKVSEPVIPYRTPTPQELVIFREKIEKGSIEDVENYIKENPKYLVSACETPVILQEGSRYNAMHVAVKANQLAKCKLIIDILGDPGFWSTLFPDESVLHANEYRSERLLNYYVNSPDTGAGDTPLHIACKFGFTKVVKFLVSLPYLEKGKVNKFQETAEEIICSRCSEDADKKKKEIAELLSVKCYITLLRAEDESKDPVLCPPIVKNSNPVPSSRGGNGISSPIDPKFQVKACAGPMSPEQAQNFFEEWKSPKRRQFLNDFEKGKERIGRSLSGSFGVPWTEHWSFLECFANLSTRSGLQKLENYFARRVESRRTASSSSAQRHTTNSDNSRGYYSNRSNNDIKTSPAFINSKTCEPDYIAKNLLKDFNAPYEGLNTIDASKKPMANDTFKSSSNSVAEELSKPHSAESRDHIVSEINQASLNSKKGPTKEFTLDFGLLANGTPSDRKSGASVFEDSPERTEVPEEKQSQLFPNEIPKLHKPLFVSGNFPSKLDFDVFRAIEGVSFAADEYPLVTQWKKNICEYSLEEKCSWPSPYSPRYRSRVPKKSSVES